MSDSELYLDEPFPERAEAPNRVERALKWSVVALSAALVVELAWFLLVVPCSPFKAVEVVGADGMQRNAILAAAGVTGKTTFFGFRSAAAVRGLQAIPEIERATVTRRFPDSLRIDVVRRTAVGVSLASVGGRIVPVSFDRNGVVFRVGPAAEGALSEGPVLSGLVFENPEPGVKMPLFLNPLLADLARLRAQAPALLDSISEIRVVKRSFDGYELVLYPAYRSVRVRIGSQLNEDVLRYMMLLLDVLASKGIDTDELDFRTGTAAYRTKEG